MLLLVRVGQALFGHCRSSAAQMLAVHVGVAWSTLLVLVTWEAWCAWLLIAASITWADYQSQLKLNGITPDKVADAPTITSLYQGPIALAVSGLAAWGICALLFWVAAGFKGR